jgi:MFS family permease
MAQPIVRATVFYGWWVVSGLAVLRLLSSGLWVYGRSTWLLPLERDLSLDRASISLVFTVGTLLIGVTGLLAGWLAERLGPRLFMTISLAVASSGFFLLAVASSLWALALIAILPLGVAFNWGAVQGPTAITNNWFERKKAYALSWLNVGNGLGGFIVPVLALTIALMGWRWAAVFSGIALLAGSLAVTFMTRNTPEEMGLLPDGATAVPVANGADTAPVVATGKTLKEALRSPIFWAMLMGSLPMLFVQQTVSIHMVPIFVWKGISEAAGAGLLGFYALMAVPLVVLVGRAADRFGGSQVMIVMIVMLLAGLFTLMVSSSYWSYALAVALLAPGATFWPVLWATIGRAFGRKHYNVIRGTSYGMMMTISAGTPWVAGIIFTRTQSYYLMLWVLVAACSLGIVGVLLAMLVQSTSARREAK